jgi:hypothetical protein
MARTLHTQLYISRLLAAVQTSDETTPAGMRRFGNGPPGDRSLLPSGAGLRSALFIEVSFGVRCQWGHANQGTAANLEPDLRLTPSRPAEWVNMSTGLR